MLCSKSPIYFTILLFLSLFYFTCDGCELEEMVRGCKIYKGSCFCGTGCYTEFHFRNRDECKATLKGKSTNVCSKNPCNNKGACIQTTSSFMKFKCRCEGTGFYGPKCQYPCPSPGSAVAKNFPYECIEI